MSSAIPVRASRRSSKARLSSFWALFNSSGVSRASTRLAEALRGAAVGLDLRLEAERAEVARVVEAVEEVVRELVRLGRDRVQVGDVVLEAALLARVETAPDPQHEQDQDQDDDPDADRAAHHDLALVIARAAERRSAAAAGCDCLFLVEECQGQPPVPCVERRDHVRSTPRV